LTLFPRRHNRAGHLLVLGCVCALCASLTACRKGATETAGPARAASTPAAGTVSIPGALEAADAVWVSRLVRTINYQRSDVLEKIVPEGTRVKKGDFLFQLDLAPIKRELEKEQASAKTLELKVVSAESKLAELNRKIEAAIEKRPSRLAPFELEVTRLKKLPEAIQLSQAHSELERLQAILAEADRHHNALADLAGKGLTSVQAGVEAQFARDIAQADVNYTQAHLDQVQRGADPLDIALAEAECEKAALEADLDAIELETEAGECEQEMLTHKIGHADQANMVTAVEEELASATYCAPKDGIVVLGEIWTGRDKREKVGAGMELGWWSRVAAVISGEDFRFRAKASEAYLGNVKIGTPVRVRLDALGETVLAGCVTGLDNPLSEESQTSGSIADLESPRPQVFDVLVSLDDVPEGLMPGMSGKVDIDLPQSRQTTKDKREPTSESIGQPLPMPALVGRDPASRARLERRGKKLRLQGYVDAVDKTALFTTSLVGGIVTKIVPSYARVAKGDVILESTGERARWWADRIKDERYYTDAKLETARRLADADRRRFEAEIKKAALDVKAAELRRRQLEALPSETSTRMAEARLLKAELELAKLQRLLELARAAGLDSQRDIESKELDVRLAELNMEAEKTELAAIEKGASEEHLLYARFKLDKAREHLAWMRQLEAASIEVRQGAVAGAEVHCAVARDEYDYALARHELRFFRSPRAGNVVFAPSRRHGDTVIGLGYAMPHYPIYLGYVADFSKLKFCGVVEEPYLSRLSPGDKAGVELLALPGVRLEGTVTGIMPLVVDREEVRSPTGSTETYSGVRATRVDIALELPQGADLGILPGMTGTATLLPAAKGRKILPGGGTTQAHRILQGT